MDHREEFCESDKLFITINSVSTLLFVMNALQQFSTENHLLMDVWHLSNLVTLAEI